MRRGQRVHARDDDSVGQHLGLSGHHCPGRKRHGHLRSVGGRDQPAAQRHGDPLHDGGHHGWRKRQRCGRRGGVHDRSVAGHGQQPEFGGAGCCFELHAALRQSRRDKFIGRRLGGAAAHRYRFRVGLRWRRTQQRRGAVERRCDRCGGQRAKDVGGAGRSSGGYWQRRDGHSRSARPDDRSQLGASQCGVGCAYQCAYDADGHA